MMLDSALAYVYYNETHDTTVYRGTLDSSLLLQQYGNFLDIGLISRRLCNRNDFDMLYWRER